MTDAQRQQLGRPLVTVLAGTAVCGTGFVPGTLGRGCLSQSCEARACCSSKAGTVLTSLSVQLRTWARLRCAAAEQERRRCPSIVL